MPVGKQLHTQPPHRGTLANTETNDSGNSVLADFVHVSSYQQSTKSKQIVLVKHNGSPEFSLFSRERTHLPTYLPTYLPTFCTAYLPAYLTNNTDLKETTDWN